MVTFGHRLLASGRACGQRSPDPARPFLKWAGGKRQLLPQLRSSSRRSSRSTSSRAWAAARCSSIWRPAGTSRRTPPGSLNLNRDLLGCYCAVGARADDVIAALADHERQHRESPAAHFYRVRDTLFNPQRSEHFGATPSVAIEELPPALAAMFIYLNRTASTACSVGTQESSPGGTLPNPRICDADNLRAVASIIAAPSVNIHYGGFELALEHARGTTALLRSPYAPVSDTANFTGYTAGRFSSEDQRRLQRAVIELAGRGCHVIVSNSTAPIISELYEMNRTARRAGLRAHRVPARRAINSKASRRGDVG